MAATSVATTFTPLHDRILVRRVEETETIRGGIIIPDSAKEKPQEGEVISVGKGKSNELADSPHSSALEISLITSLARRESSPAVTHKGVRPASA